MVVSRELPRRGGALDPLERLAKQTRRTMKAIANNPKLRELWLRLLAQELDRRKRERLKHCLLMLKGHCVPDGRIGIVG